MIIETDFGAGDTITNYNGQPVKILKVDISVTEEMGVEIFYVVKDNHRLYTYAEELVQHWQNTK